MYFALRRPDLAGPFRDYLEGSISTLDLVERSTRRPARLCSPFVVSLDDSSEFLAGDLVLELSSVEDFSRLPLVAMTCCRPTPSADDFLRSR